MTKRKLNASLMSLRTLESLMKHRILRVRSKEHRNNCHKKGKEVHLIHPIMVKGILMEVEVQEGVPEADQALVEIIMEQEAREEQVVLTAA